MTHKRRAWNEVLVRLVDIGRLVDQQGKLIPAARAGVEEATEDVAVDPRLTPIHERFVGAMDELWKEVA